MAPLAGCSWLLGAPACPPTKSLRTVIAVYGSSGGRLCCSAGELAAAAPLVAGAGAEVPRLVGCGRQNKAGQRAALQRALQQKQQQQPLVCLEEMDPPSQVLPPGVTSEAALTHATSGSPMTSEPQKPTPKSWSPLEWRAFLDNCHPGDSVELEWLEVGEDLQKKKDLAGHHWLSQVQGGKCVLHTRENRGPLATFSRCRNSRIDRVR